MILLSVTQIFSEPQKWTAFLHFISSKIPCHGSWKNIPNHKFISRVFRIRFQDNNDNYFTRHHRKIDNILKWPSVERHAYCSLTPPPSLLIYNTDNGDDEAPQTYTPNQLLAEPARIIATYRSCNINKKLLFHQPSANDTRIHSLSPLTKMMNSLNAEGFPSAPFTWKHNQSLLTIAYSGGIIVEEIVYNIFKEQRRHRQIRCKRHTRKPAEACYWLH